MRVLIIGCGYVGLELGLELVRRGHEVFGVRRHTRLFSEDDRAAMKPDAAVIADELNLQVLARWQGVTPIPADLTQPGDLEKLPGPFDWVINTVSSSKGGVEEYRAVYLEGTRHVLKWLAAHPPQKYIYTSSTSVYGQTDGAWVTQESPTEPASATSRVLVKTEKLLLQAAREKGFPAIILRVAGIYGPGRGHLFHQYLLGEARLSGDGSRLLNMIHRDDVVLAILTALDRGEPGEIYNVVDDEPVTQQDFFAWLGRELRLPPPPSEAAARGRKRGVTQKRVSNRKLRLGLRCELKYPNFRLGYAAEIARLRAEGHWPEGFNS